MIILQHVLHKFGRNALLVLEICSFLSTFLRILGFFSSVCSLVFVLFGENVDRIAI